MREYLGCLRAAFWDFNFLGFYSLHNFEVGKFYFEEGFRSQPRYGEPVRLKRFHAAASKPALFFPLQLICPHRFGGAKALRNPQNNQSAIRTSGGLVCFSLQVSGRLSCQLARQSLTFFPVPINPHYIEGVFDQTRQSNWGSSPTSPQILGCLLVGC